MIESVNGTTRSELMVGVNSKPPDTIQPISEKKKKKLLVAGGLGIAAALFLAASPELGFGSAIAGLVAGSASALTTIAAKR